ncbi:MAG: hypothetical protein R3F35_19230 [Myxococcota bacterium]
MSGREVPPGAVGSTRPAGGPAAEGASALGAERPANGATPASRRIRGSGRRLPLWVFALLILLFLFVYGYQSYHASELAEQVARLEASLADAEGRLESHRTHLLEIRSGIHDLSGRLEALQVLIDRDPAVAPAQPSEVAPDTPSTP